MWFKFVITVVKAILLFFAPPKAYDTDKLPDGAAILCPNHTSMRDPVYVAVTLGYRHRMAFMGKAELFKNKLTNWFFTSINAFPVKRGAGDIGAVKKSMAALRDGQKLVMFPEGTRVKVGEEVEAKAGAAMLAAKTGAPIVPIYIQNGDKFFKRVRLYIGDPITVTVTDKETANDIYKGAAKECMASVRELQNRFGTDK